jgi:hypothetical protein
VLRHASFIYSFIHSFINSLTPSFVSESYLISGKEFMTYLTHALLIIKYHFHPVSFNIFIKCKNTFITDALTSYMEHSHSSENKNFSSSKEIPCLLWNKKFHNRVYKSPSLELFQSQLSPVHVLTYILMLFCLLCPGLSSGSFHSCFPTSVRFCSPLTCHKPRPLH